MFFLHFWQINCCQNTSVGVSVSVCAADMDISVTPTFRHGGGVVYCYIKSYTHCGICADVLQLPCPVRLPPVMP